MDHSPNRPVPQPRPAIERPALMALIFAGLPFAEPAIEALLDRIEARP